MYSKIIWIALIATAVLPADGKKTKKKKNSDDLESTPQPNVLTYSTFGFNDVGSYDGFLQTSPDTSYVNNNKKESQMRLYAPAFPSSIDSTGLGSYYDPQLDNPSLNSDSEGATNLKTYPPVAINFFTSPSFETTNTERNTATKEINELKNDNTNYPIYGTKISSKVRNKPGNDFNNTEYNILDSVSSVIQKNYNNDHTSSMSSDHLPSSEGQHHFQFPSQSSSLQFPKVIDFTSEKKYYPTSVEGKYPLQKPIHLDVFQNSGSFESDDKKGLQTEQQSYNNIFSGKDENDLSEKNLPQGNFLSNQDHSDTYPTLNNNLRINKYRPEYKDKVRTNRYFNNNDDLSTLRNPTRSHEYSSNHSATSFKYDFGKSKPFNSSIDEIIPEASSLNFVNYRFPEKEFSGIKTFHTKPDNDDITLHSHDTYKPSEEYLEAFKDYYSGVPSTASHWGNIFKTEYSSIKKHPKKTYVEQEDDDEIVHIPKRPHSLTYEKYLDTPDTDEWPFSTRYKSKHPSKTKQPEWAKDFINNKFKAEEDLLGLRNQDSLSTSYLPTFTNNYNDLAKDYDYKLSERWRQNYLKAKKREREYETYASETNAVHVRPKPYSIDVPPPVIVPVPQPYPVKVPIPKLVTVPIIQELKVPVEKPMPYPVYKKVPYIVEKLVPVPVEKQVRVPVVKPYPVHVPQVRPVFHHTKPHDDREEEDEYEARPDTRRPVYQRHKNTRNRPHPTTRRPTRMVYRENKNRYPVRRPAHSRKRPRRPHHAVDQTPSRYHEDLEDDGDGDFIRYCKRTGKC